MREILYFFIKSIIVSVVIIVSISVFTFVGFLVFNELEKPEVILSSKFSDCSVAVVKIRGEIIPYDGTDITDLTFSVDSETFEPQTSAEKIINQIQEIKKEDSVKAVVIDIDSLGGEIYSSFEIAREVENIGKPTIAFIRSGGTSGAYLVASSAQKIMASSESDIGSIGVTASYLDNTKRNEKEGLTLNELHVGKYKELGNPDKPLSKEEKDLIQERMNEIYNHFVEYISLRRNIPIDTVKSLADGNTMSGTKALEQKLVDKIGSVFELQSYIRDATGQQDLEMCTE